MRFVGPSYHLQNREADVQRTVNLMPVVNEVAGGKSFAYLDAAPGLRVFSAVDPATFLMNEDTGLMLQENGAFLVL